MSNGESIRANDHFQRFKLKSLAGISGLALIIGGLILFGVGHLEAYHEDWFKSDAALRLQIDLVREFGIVLVSVFGISLLYEMLLASHHFGQFFDRLREQIEKGESNASRCEGMGILELHLSRESFYAKHNFEREIGRLGDKGRIRILGRSLINVFNNRKQFEGPLKAGVRLELCLCNPKEEFDNLTRMARYSQLDTQAGLDHFNRWFLDWLTSPDEQVRGTVEIRFHDFDLLDSLFEVQQGSFHRAALDMNFGISQEERFFFYLDPTREFGRELIHGRYGVIWDRATPVFLFEKGKIVRNDLPPKKEPSSPLLVRQKD
jgi:hypothetical protein